MAVYDYSCLDCGAPHEAARCDAKYCPSCRLYRGLVAVRAKFKYKPRCKVCRERFAPRHVRDTQHCGACESDLRGTAPRIDCPVCAEPGVATDGVSVCLCCAKGENQPRVIAALRKGRKSRATANAELLAHFAAGKPHIHLRQEVPVAAPTR